MATLLGLSGSLRAASYNASLLKEAATMLPPGSDLVFGSIAGVPLYNADDEAASGAPDAVKTLQSQLAAADGLLLATPEYNNSIPGVFKNAIDWMASGPGADLFVGKPVAVMGASPMAHGTMLAQNDWLPILRTLGTAPWFAGRFMVGRAQNAFDANGTLTDPGLRTRLDEFIKGFVAEIEGRTA